MCEWKPIESAPQAALGPRPMFVVCAFNVCNTLTRGSRPYTSDPWCVWRTADGEFARWPHPFQPTHWMPLPPPPEPQ